MSTQYYFGLKHASKQLLWKNKFQFVQETDLDRSLRKKHCKILFCKCKRFLKKVLAMGNGEMKSFLHNGSILYELAGKKAKSSCDLDIAIAYNESFPDTFCKYLCFDATLRFASIVDLIKHHLKNRPTSNKKKLFDLVEEQCIAHINHEWRNSDEKLSNLSLYKVLTQSNFEQIIVDIFNFTIV
jgi:hypothetical protein